MEQDPEPFRPSPQQWAKALDEQGQHFLDTLAAFQEAGAGERHPRPLQEAAVLLLDAPGSLLRHEALGEPTPAAAKALGLLMEAFLDQSQGVPSPMLKPARRSSPGRPANPCIHRQLAVAACVELLRDSGMGVSQAAREVASIWAQAGIQVSTTTAFNWHADHHISKNLPWPTDPDGFEEQVRYAKFRIAIQMVRDRCQALEPKSWDALIEAVRKEAEIWR